MAHGSKKWIRRYDGKIKRSNNRTKTDYYGELKWWDDTPQMARGYRRGAQQKAARYCPQCRYVQKQLPPSANSSAYYQKWREISAQYDAANPPPEFMMGYSRWYSQKDRYVQDRLTELGYIRWTYNDRSYLCYKCERKFEVKQTMWYTNQHGKKENYWYAIRRNYQEYRSEVKTIMRKARQYDDFEEYDAIPRHRRCWYD